MSPALREQRNGQFLNGHKTGSTLLYGPRSPVISLHNVVNRFWMQRNNI